MRTWNDYNTDLSVSHVLFYEERAVSEVTPTVYLTPIHRFFSMLILCDSTQVPRCTFPIMCTLSNIIVVERIVHLTAPRGTS